MVPANERLCPHRSAVMCYLYLEVKPELIAGKCQAQIALQIRASSDGGQHLRIKEAQSIASGCFDLVHGNISLLEQIGRCLVCLIKECGTNAAGDTVSVLSQLKGLVKACQNIFTDHLGLCRCLDHLRAQSLQHDHKFIAPQPGNSVFLAYTGL